MVGRWSHVRHGGMVCAPPPRNEKQKRIQSNIQSAHTTAVHKINYSFSIQFLFAYYGSAPLCTSFTQSVKFFCSLAFPSPWSLRMHIARVPHICNKRYSLVRAFESTMNFISKDGKIPIERNTPLCSLSRPPTRLKMKRNKRKQANKKWKHREMKSDHFVPQISLFSSFILCSYSLSSGCHCPRIMPLQHWARPFGRKQKAVHVCV